MLKGRKHLNLSNYLEKFFLKLRKEFDLQNQKAKWF
jgi:hypothetical protein